MKNILKWLGIIAAGLVVLLVLASITLYLLFPLDKIKTLAAAELSKTLRREVKIERVSLNIFTGLKLEKVSVDKLFAAEAIELNYDLWPLLRRQVVIKGIGLVRPVIQIEKLANGQFNFSDLLKPAKTPAPQPAKEAKASFELFINSFSIKSGTVSYVDRAAGTSSAVNNLNVSVSGFELALVKPVEVKASANVLYQGKNIPLALAGKIGVDLAGEKVSATPFSFAIAGEKADLSLAVSNFKKGPAISFSLSSQKLSVDPLLAIFSGQPKAKPAAKPGELTKTINQLTAALPRSLSIKGSVNIANLTFQEFTIDKIDLVLGLAGKKANLDLRSIKFYGGSLSGKLNANLNVPGVAYEARDLKLTGFDAHPFSNSVITTFLTKLPDNQELQHKVYGRLDLTASLKGGGVEPQDILKNLTGKASLTLKDGELKKLKTLAAVGDYLRSNTLKGDIKFGELRIDAGIGQSIITVSKFDLKQNDFELAFVGGIDLNRLVWVAGNRLTLKLAPPIVAGLSKEFSLLKDPSGWLELTFELTGPLKAPVPRPVLDKPLETLKKKAEEKVQAVIDEEKKKAGEAISKKVSEEAERLKKEAADKLKELIKF